METFQSTKALKVGTAVKNTFGSFILKNAAENCPVSYKISRQNIFTSFERPVKTRKHILGCCGIEAHNVWEQS